MAFRHLTEAVIQNRLDAETPIRVRALRDAGFEVDRSYERHQATATVRIRSAEIDATAILSMRAYYEWLEGHDVEGHYPRIRFTPNVDVTRYNTLIRLIGIDGPQQYGSDAAITQASAEEAVRAARRVSPRVRTPHGSVSRAPPPDVTAMMEEIRGRVTEAMSDMVGRPVSGLGPDGVLRANIDVRLPTTSVTDLLVEGSVDDIWREEDRRFLSRVGAFESQRTNIPQVQRPQELQETKSELDEIQHRFKPGRVLDLD